MDVQSGVFVRELMGFHNANLVTGDFALDVISGFRVKRGELSTPVRGCMLVGNFFDILKKIDAFGREDECKGAFTGPAVSFIGKIVGK